MWDLIVLIPEHCPSIYFHIPALHSLLMIPIYLINCFLLYLCNVSLHLSFVLLNFHLGIQMFHIYLFIYFN